MTITRKINIPIYEGRMTAKSEAWGTGMPPRFRLIPAHEFDAAVFRAAFVRGVRGGGAGEAAAEREQAGFFDAVTGDERPDNRVVAARGEVPVELEFPHVVGVADDEQLERGLVF